MGLALGHIQGEVAVEVGYTSHGSALHHDCRTDERFAEGGVEHLTLERCLRHECHAGYEC